MSRCQRDRDIKMIADPVKKRNAKCKRSKNIMKKAYELAILCSVDVNISFFDRKMKKVTEFASNPDFKLQDLLMLMQEKDTPKNAKQLKHKVFTAKDFLDANGNFNFAGNETAYQSLEQSDHDEKEYQVSDANFPEDGNINEPFDLELNFAPETKKLLNKRKFKTMVHDMGQAETVPDQVNQSQFDVLKCHIESLRKETCQKIELLESRLLN